MDWISVKDSPLYTINERGWWECTENGEKDFIAAVPYEDKRQPGVDLWWIRHCVIQDGVGLCVVGDDYNECAGWTLQDVTHYILIPDSPNKINK